MEPSTIKFLGGICLVACFCSVSNSAPTNEANPISTMSDCSTYIWMPRTWMAVADYPVEIGYDTSFQLMAACRMYVEGELVVGKTSMPTRRCYVPYQGREVEIFEDFEVLVDRSRTAISWVTSDKGDPIPPGAYGGGNSTYVATCNRNMGSGFEFIPGSLDGPSRNMSFTYN